MPPAHLLQPRQGARADARTLALSALGLPQGGALPARVDAALAGVPGAAAGYAALANAVWGEFVEPE